MSTDYPIEALAGALHAACLRDLPDIPYRDRDWEAHRKAMDALTKEEKAALYEKERSTGQAEGPFIERTRRPTPHGCSVVMFLQTWGSTALGFGGIGGQAITNAYTIIVECDHTGYRAVYFGGGKLAYLVPPQASEEQRARFTQDVAAQRLASCSDAGRVYGAVPCAKAGGRNG